MTHSARGFSLAATLVLVSTLAIPPQARAQSTSAYVYVQVQGAAGAVYGYSASSAGQLTGIAGSPFKPGTAIVGSNGTQFFTLGHTLIHSYAVGSNGAIGSQLSQVPIFDYTGGSCGNSQQGPSGAVLDHTGKYIYVLLQAGTCASYQSYKINSDGSFTFDGDTEKNLESSDVTNTVGLPSILGNETFAYSDYFYLDSGPSLIGFQRQSTGTLELMQFKETDPTLNGYPAAARPDASPAGNYVVVQLYAGDSTPMQLASYTVDTQGNISTTNTSSNMPTSALSLPNSKFSPAGDFLVLYSNDPSGGGTGMEIYEFNGAAPLTLYKTLLTGTPIDDVAWDSSNHLYAISKAQNKLWVYTVTSNSVTQDSSLSIGSPVSMVVASQASSGGGGGGGACTAPSSEGVNVCTPTENATVTSPVQIDATANVSGGVYRFELWSGSTKLASVDNSGIMNQTVSLAPGTYHLTFDARSSSGDHQYAYRDITVSGGGGGEGACTAPSSEGVNVCTPTENATVTSPVQIDAAANVSGGVYRFELWSGSTKLASVDNSGIMDQTVSLAPGAYHLTFDARSSSGDHQYASRDITVGTGGAAKTQYEAPLLGAGASPTSQVIIDTSGITTVQVTGAAANTIYMLEFCPAFVEGEYSQPSCFDVTKVSTGDSGSGGSTVKFPQAGDWAGDFSLVDSSGNIAAQTDLEPNSTTETFMATLLPETKTNGGIVTPNGSASTVQDPLSSGSVSFANGTLVFTVKGASPNNVYGIDESSGTYLDSSSSYMLSQSLTTDGSGNGSVSVNLASQGTEGGDLFQVAHQPGPSDTYERAGFIGGFTIP